MTWTSPTSNEIRLDSDKLLRGVVSTLVNDGTKKYFEIDIPTIENDFWRSAGGTLLPDGTLDPTESISRMGSVGILTNTITSTLHINGSEAGSVINITGSTVLNNTNHKVLVSNGATNITITLPDALTCLGREYIISRAAGSTGSITIQRTGTNLLQALVGTTGATTSIWLHTATGGWLRHFFTALNVGGVGIWVRL